MLIAVGYHLTAASLIIDTYEGRFTPDQQDVDWQTSL